MTDVTHPGMPFPGFPFWTAEAFSCGCLAVQDKNSEAQFGKRWCYLCEEITKLLNDKYAHTKGC